MKCPLKQVRDPEGGSLKFTVTPSGFFFRSSGRLTACMDAGHSDIICRTTPGEDDGIIQLASGHATSRLCDSIYRPGTDTAFVFSGDGLLIEPVLRDGKLRRFRISCEGPLNLKILSGYMRLHRNIPWFKPLDRKYFPKPPAGWTSWYYYYLSINEDEIVKNADWLAENLKKYGCELMQIDDGWQGKGKNNGSNRDWFVTCASKFPKGMKWCASYIRRKGLMPGLWCIPFTQSDTELFRKNPSMFMRRENGTSIGELREIPDEQWSDEPKGWFSWAGRYYLDPTNDGARSYIAELAGMLCDKWGYGFLKADGMQDFATAYEKYRTALSDSSLDGARVYRNALGIVKSVLGKKRYLLNCACGFASCGICDGVRIGKDIVPGWNGVLTALNCTLENLFMNNIIFHTDPDAFCVREQLPLEQAQAWATLVGITGQLLMVSDKMYELPEERVELVKRVLPVAYITPMDLYPREKGKKVYIFDLKVNKPGAGSWDIVALMNMDDSQPQVLEIIPEKFGMEKGAYIFTGLRDGTVRAGETLKVELPPASCRVFGIWKAGTKPFFIGTNRHLTQGAVDVESLAWDDRKLELSGVSSVVGGDPYRVRVYLPGDYRIKPAANITSRDSVAELLIEKPRNMKVRWKMKFETA
jgi:hypothetical protein